MKKKDNVILEEEFGKGALSKVDIREYSASFSPCGASAETVEFPEEFELKMPAVKNQGGVSSCHDEQTMVLTRQGWKFFKDITYEDKLASVDPKTGNLIFENPVNIISEDYQGKMIQGCHQSLNFSVTPNHKMLVRTFNSQTKHLNDEFEFVEAQDLGWWNGLLTKFHHITNEDAGSIVFEEEKISNGNILPRLEIDMHLWVQFLGIFLAEGNFDIDGNKYHNRIQLAAVKKSERDYIKNLLSSMGLHVGDVYKDRFFIFNKRIRNKLAEYGLTGVKSYDKFIPDFIFDLDEIYIKEFLYGFAMGDGHFGKNGTIVYFTSSPKMAEQLQILNIMSGNLSKVFIRKPKFVQLKDGRIIKGVHDGFIIQSRKKSISINKKPHIKTVDYIGKVYCAEMPTYHTLITKRGSDILLSGNCVAHSLSTVIEYFNELQEGSYVKMSTGYIYGNRRKSDGFKGKGMYVSDALNTVVKYGDVPNKLFNSNIEVPEAIEVFEKKALDIAEEAYPNRFTEFFALNTVDDMKLNLMQNGPIVFSIQWYKGYYVEAGTNLLKFNTQTKDGSHCMVIYGWNKYGWKFQNSWGIFFGDGGRAVYPYDAPLQTCYGVIDKICNRAKDDKINELQKKFDEISAELAIKEDEINKLNFSLNNYRDLIENQNNEIAEKQKKIAELQCSIAAEESLKATNEHIIEDAQALIKELNQDARETDANIKNCQNKIEQIKSALEDGIVLNKEELEQQIVDLENTIKGYQDKLTSINNQITDKNKTINAMQQEIATLDKNIEKLNNELSIYQNTYEEALKKLTEISEQNLLLTQEYNEALTKLNSLNETIKEQEKTINILNNQLIEIKKPYANWPRWIVKLINFIINLFGGKKK